MENRRQIESIEGEFPLPEALIQHIQSFLSGKQAARTSILSKSWYGAWATRPNLEFDQRDFGINYRNRGDEDGFWNFTKKTMQRYEDLNLKIESFKLWMKSSCFDNVEHYSYSLANELIVKAMRMGVVDLEFEIKFHNKAFILPPEVLGSKNLVRLSLTGCRIKLGADGKVSCYRLKSLSLRSVFLEGGIIRDILSSCPLIDNLLLCENLCLFNVEESNGFRAITRNLGSVIDGPINLYELHKLRCLILVHVGIDSFFACDLSSKFPCLKDLSIHYCTGDKYKGIELSSNSLEFISFKQNRMSRASFDVPSIRKFKFTGSNTLPSLSFKTEASREWESDVSLTCIRPHTSWFLELQKLLTGLSLSKISLSVKIGFIVKEVVDFSGLRRTAVENLRMHAPSSVCSTLLDCLLWICRPKFITHYWQPKSCVKIKWNNEFLEKLWKELVEGGSVNSSIANRNTFALHNLEEVNAELFEESLADWRPVPLMTLSDALATPGNKLKKVRFQLRWGSDFSLLK